MNASDVMTKTVITGKPDTTIEEAAELMLRHQISAIPILDGENKIVGMVSEGDLLRRVEGAKDQPRSWWLSVFSGSKTNVESFVQDRGKHLKNIMTKQLTVVTPETPVGQIAQLLERKHIKRVPVVKDGNLMGIVSRANLLQALAMQPVLHIDSDAAESEKRDVILNALTQVPGLKPVHLNVIVTGHRVDVWGKVSSEAEIAAAEVALEAINGMGEITVHFSLIPDYGWVF